MQCIISGATGCLGRNLSTRLLEAGHEVIALGRNERIGQSLHRQGATFIAMNLSEKERLKSIAAQADVVFHCAALSSPWGRYREFYETNVLGTQNLIEATPPSARFIHVSTPSIYFSFRHQHGIQENEPLPQKPANAYVKTKLMAEQLIDTAGKKRELQAITLRPRGIFGPYDTAIFPRVFNAQRKGVLPIIGNGHQLVDLTYVGNVVESMLLAASASSKFCARKYNITNDEPLPLLKVLALLYEAFDKPLHIKKVSYGVMKYLALAQELLYKCPWIQGEPRFTRYSLGVLAFGQTLDIHAAKTDLGYSPLTTIAQGIEHYALGYKNDYL